MSVVGANEREGELELKDMKQHISGYTFDITVRPRDTRPQAARTSQVHVFELGPKIFELNEFM